MGFLTKISSAWKIVALPAYWYHGTHDVLRKGRLKKQGKWTAYDKKQIDMPFWLTPTVKFAKEHGDNIFKCKLHLTSEQIFGDRPYTGEGRYWKDMAINEGKLLYDALDKGELFKESGDFERIFKDLIAEDFDIVETKEFVDWAISKGFKAAYVQGDGERNLMVFDPSDVEILEEIA